MKRHSPSVKQQPWTGPNSSSQGREDKEEEENNAALRRIALFMDGASRAILLSLGPLILQLLGEEEKETHWPNVIHRFSVLVIVCLLGHLLGLVVVASPFLKNFAEPGKEYSLLFRRVVGVNVAIHIFTLIWRFESFGYFLLLRIVSSLLNGVLNGWSCSTSNMTESVLARTCPDGEDSFGAIEGDEEIGLLVKSSSKSKKEKVHSGMSFNVISSKSWLTGFAISVLSGGLLFDIVRNSLILQFVTGGSAEGGFLSVILSFVFLGAVAIVTEIVLRCTLLNDRVVIKRKRQGQEQEKQRRYSSDLTGGGVTSSRVDVARRRRRSSGRDLLVSSTLMEQEELKEHKLHLNEEEDDQTVEFYDPLSLSRHPDFQALKLNSPVMMRTSSVSSTNSAHRTRLDSAMSEDFFDCTEHQYTSEDEEGDVEDYFAGDDGKASSNNMNDMVSSLVLPSQQDDQLQENPGEKSQDKKVVMYLNNKCSYGDGTPACVRPGQSVDLIPREHLQFCNNNTTKAQTMWDATMKWRREQNVWNIHSRPHPHFHKIKKAYPHFLHGLTKQGYPIVYEKPGKMNLKELFRNGCDVSDMVSHYTFFIEYISNVLCQKPEIQALGRQHGWVSAPSASFGFIVVMDVASASVSSLSGDVLRYLKEAGDINSNHYPNSLKRAILVNSPFWLAGVFSSIKGILPESVQVDIVNSRGSLEKLREYADDDQIPPEYGGSSQFELGEHPFERGLADLVEKCNSINDRQETEHREATDPNDLEDKYEFDHSRQEWTRTLAHDQHKGVTNHSLSRDIEQQDFAEEQDEISTTLGAGAWNSELTTTFHTTKRRRRPGATHEISNSTSNQPLITQVTDEPSSSPSNTGEVFVIVSIMYHSWNIVQGSLEASIPLWFLIPSLFGGLDYDPFTSGVVFFSVCIVLMWFKKKKMAKVLEKISSTSPMRAFRVGVGSMAVLLVILPFVPSSVTSTPKKQSMLVMTSITIVLPCMVIASVVARSASSVLYKIASDSFCEHSTTSPLSRFYSHERLLNNIRTGCISFFLMTSGQIIGVTGMSTMYCWSTQHPSRPFPFDVNCWFYVSSLICAFMYILSFSLHVNVVGQFASHPTTTAMARVAEKKRNNLCAVTYRRFAFIGEVIAVSSSDMASLFEEANLNSSNMLMGFRPCMEKEKKPSDSYGDV